MVSGVVEESLQNSHIKFNGLISLNALWQDNPCTKWDCNYSFYTYFLLNSGSNSKDLEEKLPDFLWEPMNKKNAEAVWKEVAYLMRLGNIRFNSTSNFEREPPGNTDMVYLFSAIAFFILVIACVSFINLTNAQATKKDKEIGIQKVNGANVEDILLLFSKDFIKWVAIAFFIAIPIAWFTMNLWLESFAYETEIGWWIFMVAGGLALLISLLTVSWQSWSAARTNPVKALRYE